MIGSSFIFTSGPAMTMPSGLMWLENNLINLYGKTNSFRLPPYHRLDISATYTVRKTQKYESQWVFSLFNAYNRQNIFIWLLNVK
ncbi:MAG: hypothetical protein HC906_12140 [Bacteroidales bacterium]|nr:hypothetical protein [Bacteroidales bacterium]